MSQKVAKIDRVFSIKSMGTVIALPKEDDWLIAPDTAIRSSDRIQIRTPEGHCISTFIKSIELIRRNPEEGSVCFSLPHPIAVEDIPEGSELWLEPDGKGASL